MSLVTDRRNEVLKSQSNGGRLIAQASPPAIDDLKLLDDLNSDNAEERYNAWIKASSANVDVVPKIAAMLDSDKPGIVKAAEYALENIAHSVGKTLNNPSRQTVNDHFVQQLKDGSQKVKVFMLRTMSLIADGDNVEAVLPYMDDEKLREEAVYCLQRIPGKESTEALLASYKKAPDDFKRRIAAAFGQRKDKAAVSALTQTVNTGSNQELVMDAMDAIARIGEKPEDIQLPNMQDLPPHLQSAYKDATLRYYATRGKAGETEDAIRLSLFVLNGEPTEDIEEHYRCAAMVNLSNIPHSESVRGIASQLDHESFIVRATAKKLLLGMEGNVVDDALKAQLETAEGERKEAIQAVIDARKAG